MAEPSRKDDDQDWRPIPGVLGIDYEVSSHGKVRRSRPDGRGRVDGILEPFPHGGGYLGVTLPHPRKPGAQKKFYVHHLVAWAHIGDRPPGAQVHHLDGNRYNNKAVNLRYASPRQNALARRALHGR